MLKTKSIKTKPTPEDGMRISVMSRHTLTDGVTPDPDIHEGLYDEWWPELAPDLVLVGAYYNRGLPWEELTAAYRRKLKRAEVAESVYALINLASTGTVTILCIEDEPSCCHRRLLAEECVSLRPDLPLEIS